MSHMLVDIITEAFRDNRTEEQKRRDRRNEAIKSCLTWFLFVTLVADGPVALLLWMLS